MTDNLSTTLYLQYLSALKSAITLPGDPQIVSPYQIWDWGDTQGSMAGMTYTQYLALNQVPISPGADSSSWGARPGFDSTYQKWLTIALNPYPDQNDPEYVRLQNAVQSTISQRQAAQQTATTNYKNFVQSSRSTESYTAWLQNEGASYSSLIALAQETYDVASNALTAYIASKTSKVQDAVTAYTNGLISVTDPTTNSSRPVAGWATGQSAYNYVNKITKNNPGGRAAAGNSISFSINQASETYDYQHSWATAEAGFVWDFFLGEGEGSWSRTSTDSFSSEYALTFSFGDLSVIDVLPGPWYSPGLPALMGKNGPYNETYSGFRSGSDTYFFGPPEGELARIITALVVGYQPKVTISAGSSFTSTLEQKWDAEGGLVIGPFEFGGASGSNSEHDTFDSSGANVTLTNNGSWPYVVAMVSNWVVPPAGKSLAARGAKGAARDRTSRITQLQR